MTSFVGLSPIFNTINDGGSTRAFTGMALVMMSLRFILAIQYGVVFYFVHGFHKIFLPLLLTILVYLLSGFAFLTTYLIDRKTQFTGTEGATHMIRWYIILSVEILAVNLISSKWRVLSFRHTHLVERVGLLTLIVMGEGIIGMIKSVAYDLLGRNATIWTEAGLIVAAVVLIYFIYILYFNQIDHNHSEERWGTIRQQIWLISHYFLHIAILLTVEGQAALMIWNNCRRGINWFMSEYPSIHDPGSDFNSNAELVSAVNDTVVKMASRFHYYDMTDYYNPAPHMRALLNNTSPFKSPEWNSTASRIMSDIRWNIQYYIFVNFRAEGPKSIDDTSDACRKLFLYNQSFRVVFAYFYIGAGGLLLVIAGMYWFGKTNKRRDEYWSIAMRVLVGLCLPFVSMVAFLETPGDMSSFRYRGLQWLIPIVVFCYLAVLIADNLIKVFFSVRNRHTRHNVLNADSSYRPDPRTGQKRVKTVKFEDVRPSRRHLSSDSESTLADDEGSSWRGTRGYSHVRQYESIDGRDLERERQQMRTKHDDRTFSFEQQLLIEGQFCTCNR